MTATDRPGVCRFCRCSEHDPCRVAPYRVEDCLELVGCHWIDATETVCSVCVPAMKAEAQALKVYGSILTAPLALAYHAGFVVGWFNVRGNLRRNPYLARQVTRVKTRAFLAYAVWDRGLLAGEQAGLQYRSACGPLDNALHVHTGRRHGARPRHRRSA